MQKKKSLNKKKRKTSDSAREVATPVINHGYPPIKIRFYVYFSDFSVCGRYEYKKINIIRFNRILISKLFKLARLTL